MHFLQALAATLAVRAHFKAAEWRAEAADAIDELVVAFPGEAIEHLATYRQAELRLALADFLDTLAGWETAR